MANISTFVRSFSGHVQWLRRLRPSILDDLALPSTGLFCRDQSMHTYCPWFLDVDGLVACYPVVRYPVDPCQKRTAQGWVKYHIQSTEIRIATKNNNSLTLAKRLDWIFSKQARVYAINPRSKSCFEGDALPRPLFSSARFSDRQTSIYQDWTRFEAPSVVGILHWRRSSLIYYS